MGLAVWPAGCRTRPSDLPEVPEVLNTRVVFAPQCGRVFFSSNRNGSIAPFGIDAASAQPTVFRLDAPRDRDLLVRSVSPDCSMLALVSDHGGDGLFDVFLYDLDRGAIDTLTHSRQTNDGDPLFSPTRPILAYLSDGRLMLYDYKARHTVPGGPSPTEFTSLIWSADGNWVYLEDERTDLWQYHPGDRTFRLLWKAPQRAYTRRLGHSFGHSLYFLSDHEAGVSQIYELDVVSSQLRRVHRSSHDQYSPARRHDELLFRTSIDGHVTALRLRGEQVDTLSPRRGVVYDFSLDFDQPLFVYAGDRAITSIYAGDPEGPWIDLLAHRFAVAQPPAREFRTSEGMVHFVFTSDSQPDRWVVWLHGGPREQVSPRFNPYFDFLVRLGYDVVALNYPGSTGIGNQYELDGVPAAVRVDRQLAGIDEGLAQVRRLYPGFDRYVLVAVSYGSAIGFLHVLEHPAEVIKFVDFSGVTTSSTAPDLRQAPAGVPPILSIRGTNDPHQRTPERRRLLKARKQLTRVTDVLLEEEGHYIGRMESMRRILARMEQFLAPASR